MWGFLCTNHPHPNPGSDRCPKVWFVLFFGSSMIEFVHDLTASTSVLFIAYLILAVTAGLMFVFPLGADMTKTEAS